MDIDGKKSQEENNELLLSAIKKKFENRKSGNINAAIFKPKQFVIPPLRVPPTAATIPTKTTAKAAASPSTNIIAAESPSTNIIAAASSSTTTAETIKGATRTEPSQSPLNQFLLNQLRQKNINGLSEGFKLPELKIPGESSNKKTFNIPLLNRFHEDYKGGRHIEKDLQNLTINPEVGLKDHKQHIKIASPSTNTKKTEDILIDLTSALIINPNGSTLTNRPAATETKRARDSVRAKNALDFKIPHIECDRKTSRKRNNNGTNELLCTLNVPHIKYKPVKPSALGEALSASDKCLNNQYLPCAATPLEKLHLKVYKRSDYGTNIKRFRFDTKSPDDLVKESLAKCQRISYT